MSRSQPGIGMSLLAGGAAGLSVDIALFPLDTIKTRLQSEHGFWKTGNLRGIYSGLGPAAVGSFPAAAAFFSMYELVKHLTQQYVREPWTPLVHMGAASCGEVVGCVVRVPFEVVKQRRQVSQHPSALHIIRSTFTGEGFLGFYRGYCTTVLREIPFSLIQFPLWELLKKTWSQRLGRYIDPWQASLCGAMAGGVAAGMTTPLDVAKTRIMLADKSSHLARGKILPALRTVFVEKGIRGLFAGIVPRVIWISVGGCIFFGAYEEVKYFIMLYG